MSLTESNSNLATTALLGEHDIAQQNDFSPKLWPVDTAKAASNREHCDTTSTFFSKY